jgi:hypothetical protein
MLLGNMNCRERNRHDSRRNRAYRDSVAPPQFCGCGLLPETSLVLDGRLFCA